MSDYTPFKPDRAAIDVRCLEAVTTCVGWDELLDVTLTRNHPHLDTMIVVTSHDDAKTKRVIKKHGVTLVETDLFKKDGRSFNKGAAINAGFNYFRFHGWRLHLDADIILPDNFRRLLFNHSYLDPDCLYGCDRVNVIGQDELAKPDNSIQYRGGKVIMSAINRHIGARYIDDLAGYVPLGYFQLWHASKHRRYPWSLGTADQDDIAFSALWPLANRRLLPEGIVYHLVTEQSRKDGKHFEWDGERKQPRLS